MPHRLVRSGFDPAHAGEIVRSILSGRGGPTTVIYVDADACPVRNETVRVAERHGEPVTFVTNGGLRPTRHPLVRIVVVERGADEADKWIAERIASGDVCVTADVPLAARCVGRGALVLAPDGAAFTIGNVGERLAMRDLMADLRAADPFRQGSGRLFGGADRARFLEALERAVRAARRERGEAKA
jgi:uncharacterized protein YaiI (UPF0178 family)